MVAQGSGGDIVHIVSKNGVVAGPSNVRLPALRRPARRHLVRLLAAELGPHGIRVNGINPDTIIKGSGIFGGEWLEDRAEAYGVKPTSSASTPRVARCWVRRCFPSTSQPVSRRWCRECCRAPPGISSRSTAAWRPRSFVSSNSLGDTHSHRDGSDQSDRTGSRVRSRKRTSRTTVSRPRRVVTESLSSADREEQIFDLLGSEGRIEIATLAEALDVSKMTVRHRPRSAHQHRSAAARSPGERLPSDRSRSPNASPDRQSRRN